MNQRQRIDVLDTAFAVTIALERRYLLRVAGARLHDAALVEDLVQETLLAALHGAARFEGRAPLRTWLTAILLRRIADHQRQRSRRPETDVPPDAPHALQAIDWIDPQRRLEAREQLDALARALALHPPVAARLLALRGIDGLGADEAARRLGLSSAYAAALLHRTRRRLRKQLAAPIPRPATRRRALATPLTSNRLQDHP